MVNLFQGQTTVPQDTNKQQMTFSTSPDKIVRKKTIAVFILFTILPFSNLLYSSDKWVWYVGFFSFFMLLLLLTYLYKPLKYEVYNNKIIVHRLIGNVELNIEDIIQVHRIQHDVLKSASRGGAFGYSGEYDTDLGKIRFYATRRDKFVMIIKNDKTKIILTPDREDEFFEYVKNKVCQQ